MESLFFNVIREDCQEISSSQNENGLLEIVMPKNYGNKEIWEYFKGLGSDKYNEIVDKQNKAKEVFRKKINKMIDKCKENFCLQIRIKLRIQAKSKKLNDCNVELYGIFFEGHLLINAVLQYYPDEILEKIVRYCVFSIAREYEIKFSRIEGITVNKFEFPDGEIENCEFYKVSEKEKYIMPLEFNEIEKIKADYDSAVEMIINDMKKSSIMSF